MYEWLEIIFLAVLQGIAEFLPISSSGHLIIAERAMEQLANKRFPDLLELNIALHLGTLGSILVVYWQRILRLLTVDRRVIGLVIVATLPAVVSGLPMHEIPALKAALESPLLTGWMLLVTSCLLIWGSRHSSGTTEYQHLSYGKAFIIGCAQAFAILPGVSRSGSTIVGGLGVGLRRDDAATFSFLMAIPVTAGAVILEGKDVVLDSLAGTRSLGNSLPMIVGIAVAFIVGIVTLRVLLHWLRAGKLHYFAFWCFPMGLLVIAWQLGLFGLSAPAVSS